MEIIYTAKRELVVGHVLNDSYTINIGAVTNLSTSIKGKQASSLNGNTVTIIHNDETYLNIVTDNVSVGTTPTLFEMREFLNSVKAGEIFSLDAVDVMLTSITNPYAENRLAKTDYFSYTFKIRKL